MNQDNPSVLEAAIVRTVAWFSLFDYPMTAFEIWKWLDCKCSLAEVETILRESVWLRGRLEYGDGFFVLGGRSAEALVTLRQERSLDAARKFKKLNRAVRYFSIFPFVRAVFACNTLAWRHTAPASDIDLFIVVAPGTIWLSRFLLVAPFVLLRNRPSPSGESKGEGDPFCFSFFITDNGLSLENLLLPEGDPYMAYWLVSLIPIFDRGRVQKQLTEKNKWAFELLPNVFFNLSDKALTGFWLLNFLKIFERPAGFFQKKFLPRQIKEAANLDSRVIVSGTILKFHLNDRRAYFRDEWKKLYEAYGAG